MRSPSPYGVAEDGVSSTLSIFNRIGTSLHQGPHVGRLGSNQHPLALYHLSYTPDGRRSTCPPMSGRRPPASYAKLGQTAIHEPAVARTSPSTPPLQRVHRGVSTSVDGSQAGQDSNLQHTVPKTIVPPIAPPAYTMRPTRPRWSRFARPITRWAPSAGAGGDGHRPPVRHHAPLGLPRQGGCRGDPPHGSGARRDPHARRVAYLACLRRDSNPRPSAPEADALSTGPRRRSVQRRTNGCARA